MAKFDDIGCLPIELYSGKTEQFIVSPSIDALSISRCVVFSVIWSRESATLASSSSSASRYSMIPLLTR